MLATLRQASITKSNLSNFSHGWLTTNDLAFLCDALSQPLHFIQVRSKTSSAVLSPSTLEPSRAKLQCINELLHECQTLQLTQSTKVYNEHSIKKMVNSDISYLNEPQIIYPSIKTELKKVFIRNKIGRPWSSCQRQSDFICFSDSGGVLIQQSRTAVACCSRGQQNIRLCLSSRVYSVTSTQNQNML